MKQIFDWLREQIRNRKSKEDFLEDRVWNHAIRMCMEFVDEAEAKWESEVCEWTHKEHHANCFCSHNLVYEEYDFVLSWKYCPYCGKPIKISEVEKCV